MVNNWLDIIQELLLPPTCILCGNSGFDSKDICPFCYSDLQKNIHCCYRCASIFETPSPMPQLCGKCISKQPFFDESYIPFIHQGIIRHLIAALKFKREYKNARLLGQLLANYLNKTAEFPEIIIPVPLHKQRVKERGFNQSIEIARTVSKILEIPVETNCCKRVRNTAHQVDLPAKQRNHNMNNAFAISKPIVAQHVAILDDVITTGSTVNELAKILKKAGVARVDVWGCGRA